MTSAPIRAALCAFAMLIVALPVRADDDEAKRHFRIGVTLYRDGNYAGALAEFDEAKRARKTASVLQNIALCQKALFQYTDAIATLEELEREFGATLPASEMKAVREAVDALRTLVVNVVVVVNPPDATVTIDGKPLAGGAERAIDMALGQRKIEAQAPNYRPFVKNVTVSASEHRTEVTLAPDVGALIVTSADKRAVVSVDGVSQGGGIWSGEVRAGAAHAVIVSHAGVASPPFSVTVSAGERREIAEPADAPPYAGAPAYAGPPAARTATRHQGPYAMVGATSYFISTQPDHYHVSNTQRPSVDGAYFNARVGYRAVERFGLEGFVESGEQAIGSGCYSPGTGVDDCGSNYTLIGTRLGIGGRYFSPGETLRFIAGIGLGAAYHSIDINPGGAAQVNDPVLVERAKTATGPIRSSGWNGFALFEAGVQVSLNGFLIDGVVVLAGDGVSKLRDDSPANGQLYAKATNIWMGGFGARVGYALW